MSNHTSSFDRPWRDTVAAIDEPLTSNRQGEDAVNSVFDLVSGIVECVVGPLQTLAETLPPGTAFERRAWQRHWRRARARYARSFDRWYA
jgi:hypothetical protein